MPIGKLWGVGQVMGRELKQLGIETIGDLARWPREELVARFGLGSGEGLFRASHGLDDSPVTPEHEAKSLSREETFARDVRDGETLRRELLRLSDEVAWRLRRHALQARTVNLKLRYADFSTLTRQVTLPDATDSGPVLYAHALALFEKTWDRRPLRLVGVGGTNLERGGRQLRLFEQDDRRQAQLDAALDRIRAKYGESSIRRASLMDEPEEPWVSRKHQD
jgi:nucleotidyltransferase/DNA polymerase involved in DNA repair